MQSNLASAVFDNRSEAQRAIEELRAAGGHDVNRILEAALEVTPGLDVRPHQIGREAGEAAGFLDVLAGLGGKGYQQDDGKGRYVGVQGIGEHRPAVQQFV